MSDVDDPTRFDPQRFFGAGRKLGHNHALGLAYRDHGLDWAELTLPWRADLVGDRQANTLASGAIITLMDMASGLSIWTRLGHFRPVVTLDLRIDYLRAARPKADIIGRVECYRVAREVAFVRGVAHDGLETDLVAHVAGSFMFTGPAMIGGLPNA